MQVYPVEHQSFLALTRPPLPGKDGNGLDVSQKIFRYLGQAVVCTLKLNMSPESQKTGGFKLATFGATSQPIFSTRKSLEVCAKQTFYKKPVTQHSNGKQSEVLRKIPYDSHKQVQDLSMEITCLVWARMLLDIVYQFIKEKIAARGPPPFEIPTMRFVDAALAIEEGDGKSDPHVFLLEEVIENKLEGKFRKYLNNVSLKPPLFPDEADNVRAKFLAFTQHVQYFKTKKLAIVSDYQGKLHPIIQLQSLT